MTQNSITGSVVGQDTICALATPAGGAIGVIRVSGPKAWQTVSKVFSKDLATAKPNTLHYGEVHDAQGRTVDDVIVSLWKAPHSYTGEDDRTVMSWIGHRAEPCAECSYTGRLPAGTARRIHYACLS